MDDKSDQEPPIKFRKQALPFPEDFMEALHREFAGCRARVAAAMEANRRDFPNPTLEQMLAQVRRFSLLSGKTEEERKEILRRERLE